MIQRVGCRFLCFRSITSSVLLPVELNVIPTISCVCYNDNQRDTTVVMFEYVTATARYHLVTDLWGGICNNTLGYI